MIKHGILVTYDDVAERSDKKVDYIDAKELVFCNQCIYLDVLNHRNIYAICKKTKYIFEPFETNTKSHFCSFGKMK